MNKIKKNPKKEEIKVKESLITYTKHLEKRLRNLETEKQLLDAERLRLEQEGHILRFKIDKLTEQMQHIRQERNKYFQILKEKNLI